VQNNLAEERLVRLAPRAVDAVEDAVEGPSADQLDAYPAALCGERRGRWRRGRAVASAARRERGWRLCALENLKRTRRLSIAKLKRSLDEAEYSCSGRRAVLCTSGARAQQARGAFSGRTAHSSAEHYPAKRCSGGRRRAPGASAGDLGRAREGLGAGADGRHAAVPRG